MPLDNPATSEKWPSGPFINSLHCVEFGHPADRLIQPSLGLRSISVKRFEATLRMSLDELAASEKWRSRLFINSPVTHTEANCTTLQTVLFRSHSN